MSCFPCFTSQRSRRSQSRREHGDAPPQENIMTRTPNDMKKPNPVDPNQVDTSNIKAHNYTFRELATATKNFRQECLLGQGGFGRVYRGTIPTTGQVVAVKQLDRHGMQGGSKEFLVEVLGLSLMHHENLVNLIGYCADGDQRLLVHEFVSGGSLESRLLERKPDQPPLDWYNRIKIASNVANGLEYLHDQANPPVIYRDLKSSNVLLDGDLNAKLSDYGMAKLGGGDNKTNLVPTRVMGTYGYSAPEYVRTGNLTLKSDVYSFGVVLLELITGRRAVDTTRPNDEQNLVQWAQPFFRDPKRFPDMADPNLGKRFPEKDLNQAVAIAAMCLQEEAAARPLMSDVVTTLSFLSMVAPAEPEAVPATSASKKSAGSKSESESESESERGNEHNENVQSRGAASSKYQETNVSDTDDDDDEYYEKEHQHDSYSPQDTKSSRKSSTTLRKTVSSGRRSSSYSESEDGRSVSSSNKSSRKSRVKSGRKSRKSSRKSSVRKLNSSSGESQDGGVGVSRGNISFDLISSENSSGRSEEGSVSIQLDRTSSTGSDE